MVECSSCETRTPITALQYKIQIKAPSTNLYGPGAKQQVSRNRVEFTLRLSHTLQIKSLDCSSYNY